MEQPVGELVSTQHSRLPTGAPLDGRYTGLRRLDPSHAPSLYRHLGGEANRWRWTYMMSDGFPTAASCTAAVAAWCAQRDPFFYAVFSGPPDDDAAASEPAGLVSLMAAAPEHGRVEVGSVILGAGLARSRRATEAFYLLLRHAVEGLGFRRVEWKANRLNAASLAAATRLGFTFEGIFRKHMVVKGRRRDTAWFSITDDEWPAIKAGFEAWLDEANFDENGRQRRTLQQCREATAAAAAAATATATATATE